MSPDAPEVGGTISSGRGAAVTAVLVDRLEVGRARYPGDALARLATGDLLRRGGVSGRLPSVGALATRLAGGESGG